MIEVYDYSSIPFYIRECKPKASTDEMYEWGVECSFNRDRNLYHYIAPTHWGKKWLNDNNIKIEYNKFTRIDNLSGYVVVYFMPLEDLKNMTAQKYCWLCNQFEYEAKKLEIENKLERMGEDFV